jgi:hypothetical protein
MHKMRLDEDLHPGVFQAWNRNIQLELRLTLLFKIFIVF